MGRITSYHDSGKRYLVLRIVGVCFEGIGAIFLMVGTGLLVFGLYSLQAGLPIEPTRGGVPIPAPPALAAPSGPGPGGVFSVGVFSALVSLGLLVSGLQFLGIGTFIRLAIHLEENTRATAQALDRIRSRLEPREDNLGTLFVS